MPKPARTNDPISISLPQLLGQRKLSMRELARRVDVSQSYLSRISSAPDSEAWRPPSKKILAAIADALDLPPDYFPEYRRLIVEEAIAADPRVRDRLYDSLRRAKK